jgi:hypothetical protein
MTTSCSPPVRWCVRGRSHGLAEFGIGFKSLGEAVYLRNQILEWLDFAASTADDSARRQALTFVVIGGGYAGIEALGELADMTAAVAPVFDGAVAANVRGTKGAWTADDCAAVPDLTSDEVGALCPPTAQHAARASSRSVSSIGRGSCSRL